MALAWIDKVDGLDDVLAADINSLAGAIISLEELAGTLNDTLESRLGGS